MIKDPRSSSLMITGTTKPAGLKKDYDAFFGKMKPSGELEWGFNFGKEGDQVAEKVLFASDTNEYLVVGETSESFDNMKSWSYQSGSRIFVLKFDGQGKKKWSIALDAGTNTRFLDAVYVPKRNKLIVAGLLSIGATEGLSFVWTVSLEDGYQKHKLMDVLPLSLAYDDAEQDIIVAGISYGPVSGTNTYKKQGFIGKMAYTGEMDEVHYISPDLVPAAITCNENCETLFMTGAYVKTTATGPNIDIIIGSYRKADGKELWSERWGQSGLESGYLIDYSKKSKVLVIAGTTTGSLDDNENQGNEDAFLAAYDENGKRKYSNFFGTKNFDIISSMFIDQEDDSIYVLVHQFIDIDTHKYGQLVNIQKYLDSLPSSPSSNKPQKTPDEKPDKQENYPDHSPSAPKRGMGGVGTFFLVVFILGFLGGAGYFGYMKYLKPRGYVHLPLGQDDFPMSPEGITVVK